MSQTSSNLWSLFVSLQDFNIHKLIQRDLDGISIWAQRQTSYFVVCTEEEGVMKVGRMMSCALTFLLTRVEASSPSQTLQVKMKVICPTELSSLWSSEPGVTSVFTSEAKINNQYLPSKKLCLEHGTRNKTYWFLIMQIWSNSLKIGFDILTEERPKILRRFYIEVSDIEMDL